jgi:hypothetical protein
MLAGLLVGVTVGAERSGVVIAFVSVFSGGFYFFFYFVVVVLVWGGGVESVGSFAVDVRECVWERLTWQILNVSFDRMAICS